MSGQRSKFSFSGLPIARKLVAIVTATTVLALALSSLSIVAYDAWDARHALKREVEIMGQIVSDRSMAALSFRDARSASETLAALSARPSILEATLFTADGQVLARFSRSPDAEGAGLSKGELPPDGSEFVGDQLVLVRTIAMEGEAIGRLMLVSDLSELRARQARFFAIAFGAAVVAFVIAFLLSSRLRMEVSGPVISLAAAARRVTNERDYSSRVAKPSEDELGDLVTSFNEMLEEIERREVELRAERDRAEELAARERQLFEEASQAKQELEAQILERERLEEQILHVQKMEAVGRLAGGIAHDFNNMLMVIRGYTEASLHDPDCTEQLREYLTEVDLAAQRAHATTKQLLIFSRQQVLKVETIELNDCVRETLNMLERLIGEDVELSAELTDADLFVRGDAGQLQQVLVNLAVNARDAMPTGGSLVITTRVSDIELGEISEELQLQPGSYAVLTVKDTGEGIPSDLHSKIFDPFYTTKPAGKGTGLGLSSVYGLVSMSGGAIRLESEPGQGASFEIFLPVADAPGSDVKGEPGIKRGSGNETILLVEDEPPVRRLVERLLDLQGYRVLVAENGVEALEISRAHDGTIDLVITDVVMPKMNAGELIERLAEERPDTPVLLISGYLDDVISRYGIEVHSDQLLDKPFTEEELLAKVRGLIDADR